MFKLFGWVKVKGECTEPARKVKKTALKHKGCDNVTSFQEFSCRVNGYVVGVECTKCGEKIYYESWKV